MKKMIEIPVRRFVLFLEFLDDFTPPSFPGNAIRGGFGSSLRRSVCASRRERCEDCILRFNCIYSRLFESPIEGRKFAPHPFVFRYPVDEMVYRNGDVMEIELVLIGRYIEEFPYFLHAFREFGKSGIGKERAKFMVKEVKSGGNLVYDGERIFRGWQEPEDFEFVPIGGNRIRVNFLTPLRIIHEGKLVDVPEFYVFYRALARRISLLVKFYGGKFEKKDLTEKARGVKIVKVKGGREKVKRFSSRQGRSMELHGFRGEIVYEGDLGEFMELLRWGEILHVGKSTSFGMGRYVIEKNKI